MPETLSIRSLAARLNLSRATVSEALRGSPRVKESTRRRVIDEAGTLGYRLDPVASELMAEMRRSRSNAFRGSIALVTSDEEPRLSPTARRRHALLRQGAEERARELGFKLDPISVNGEGRARLPGVLRARGVVGTFLLPSEGCGEEQRAMFGDADIPVVHADAPEEGAEHVDAVAPDYRQALILACRRLAAQERLRPGIVLSGESDAAVNLRWLAAWESMRHSMPRGRELPAPLHLESRLVPGAAVAQWKREHAVDVLLVPETLPPGVAGPFCALDLLASPVASTGLDLRWTEIGSRAMELLVRGHFDRQRGIQSAPALHSIPARWRASEMTDEPERVPPARSGCAATGDVESLRDSQAAGKGPGFEPSLR